MPEDWFRAFAKKTNALKRRSRATGATGATVIENSLNTELGDNLAAVAQWVYGRATGATAKSPECPARMEDASAAPVAQKTWISATKPFLENTAKDLGVSANVAPVARVAPEIRGSDTGHSSDTWDAADWQAHFDERAAIAEYDHGLTRPEAQAHSFDCCVAEYLSRHTPSSTAQETRANRDRDVAIRREAVGILSSLGLGPPPKPEAEARQRFDEMQHTTTFAEGLGHG